MDIEKLTYETQFDFLFSDASTLRASAVQGVLALTSFRHLAWMIFLECVPHEKSEWLASVTANRRTFQSLRTDFHCDPHSAAASDKPTPVGVIMRTHHRVLATPETVAVVAKFDDHPLSNEPNSVWQRYFADKELKAVIHQDVIRMFVFRPTSLPLCEASPFSTSNNENANKQTNKQTK